ncbi:hypothetical protein [Lactiplantibacillus plantarum]|uniref:hypothetical protein n=2 Tax=Lactiplantibacillus plantarum TaxID=1590 RepID=UPI000C80E7D7|nr:hypothetical protein [Lactiplantibacillus plantarum]MBO2704031.1 hypothetical protein [Lactiplantibacillus plantarum]PME02936.1 hypothetical protein S101520_00078 [Lactiplantibacillus plantarum subsp. plantarum]WRM17394.1 hypothetical protein T1K45_15055 [Lactiplantibacillus plantarum]DAV14446.1 MAG TPA: hypothetical protein [Caudoviricetes sp.]
MTNYILFRMDNGNKIPIESGATNDITMILPMNDEQKNRLLKDYPESKNNLYMFISGVIFKLD